MCVIPHPSAVHFFCINNDTREFYAASKYHVIMREKQNLFDIVRSRVVLENILKVILKKYDPHKLLINKCFQPQQHCVLMIT